MRIAIIGAGMAGLSCARRLRTLGLEPVLFDKGKGAAGRMASRRLPTPLGEAAFDMGAQFFTVRSPLFAIQTADWAAAGLAAPWPEAGPDAWVGTPLMSSPLKAMTEGLEVRWNSLVGGVSRAGGDWRVHVQDGDEGPFDAVVIALPAEQATPFLALNAPLFQGQNAICVSKPCWTGLFAFDAPLRSSASILRDRGAVAWAARNSAKPGRVGPEAWVVHGEADWSRDRLEAEPQAVLALLLGELLALTGDAGRTPIAAHAHRWRFSRSTGLGLGALWDRGLAVGVCGDWLLAPRVESAWLSGFELAQRIAEGPRRRWSETAPMAAFEWTPPL
ncbi:MAG TPA: FAD-dependent oxidoreductase [Caulobacteraceae bacterium]|nr:FAD-dependent oxidoreductase [Caulobacteraceae bacterium]